MPHLKGQSITREADLKGPRRDWNKKPTLKMETVYKI